jgi:hypothetical protein
MKENDPEAEALFFERLDCCFPYYDRDAASAFIREGFEISLNGAFGVLEEICRPPQSAGTATSRLLELLDEWLCVKGVDFHPLAGPVSQFAAAMIRGVHTPTAECLRLMATVGQYPAQRAALNIVVLTGYPDDEEGQRRFDDLDSEIRGRWDQLGV